MKHSMRLAAVISVSAALGVTAMAWADQVHGAPAAKAVHLAPPAKDDVHVKQLYELMKAAHAPGAHPDHAQMQADVKAIARAHAVEVGQDADAMEAHVMQVAHAAMMAATGHPEKMASLDGFWDLLHSAGAAQH
jgi:hypothetical protein